MVVSAGGDGRKSNRRLDCRLLAGNYGLPSKVDEIGYYDASKDHNRTYDYDTSKFNFEPGNECCIHNPTDASLS
ncbi:MAG: hypothetical protein R6U17_09000 [Thermoplasmata archaeon]